MASSNDRPRSPAAAAQSLSGESSHSNTVQGNASPHPAVTKAVSIAEPESISPLMTGKSKDFDQNDSFDLDKSARQFRASVSGKRLSGRPSLERIGSASRASMTINPALSFLSDDSEVQTKGSHVHEGLLKQVTAWLKHEKGRRAARKARRKAATKVTDILEHSHAHATHEPSTGHSRRPSDSSEGSVALEQLAEILERTLSLKATDSSSRKRRSSQGNKLASLLKRPSIIASDTDYFDGAEELVPSCEAVLDNSKTLAYGGGGLESGEDTSNANRKGRKEKEAWATFKYEIVRLTHTLRLKGWRRMPLDQSGEIEVERLSGALTNCVYVVSPPSSVSSQKETEDGPPMPKNPPPKLLLRIYGAQVDHLIDREAELQILRRLARKRIGPRLLGTFTNGRFEEFFHAKTLTPKDLRIPETSKQIAKRMRELHEGIDLLKTERDDGPFVWRNWDKWVSRCEKMGTWLDQQIKEAEGAPGSPQLEAWKQRGLICGLEWSAFRQMVEKYRVWLEQQYGGIQKINERLVFAHNDTQYGNILRLIPAGESPLLLPANEHKQLVVIDFEYANANLPGLEFANHFTEWCYNYHDPEGSYRCNTAYYPTPEEQYRFIRSYLVHNPSFKAPGGSASNPPTPYFGPLHTSGSTTALTACAAPTSISAFMLDSRAPPGERYSYQEQEAQVEQDTEEEVKRLMAETRLWRLANSAMWVAWGIVQASVPGMPDSDGEDEGGKEGAGQQGQELESATLEVKAEAEKEGTKTDGPNGGPEPDSQANDEEEEEEFDYLSYAQERAMFVWGDAIRLGIVKPEDLPEDLRNKVKMVDV